MIDQNNFQSEKTIFKLKNSLEESHHRPNTTTKNQPETRVNKTNRATKKSMYRASVIFATIDNSLIYISSESQKKRKDVKKKRCFKKE